MPRCAILMLIAAVMMPAPLCLHAQQSSIVKLTVEKKRGAHEGQAMATIKGPAKVKGNIVMREKTGRFATHALQAWIILDGQGALLLLSPEKNGMPNRLRYYELDAGKGRLLGHVPLSDATIVERKPMSDQWAFAISGIDPVTQKPLIFVGDTHALHARIDDGSRPQFSADSLSFETPGGAKSLTLAALVGLDYQDAIYAPATNPANTAYLEFLRDGDSLSINSGGAVER